MTSSAGDKGVRECLLRAPSLPRQARWFRPVVAPCRKRNIDGQCFDRKDHPLDEVYVLGEDCSRALYAIAESDPRKKPAEEVECKSQRTDLRTEASLEDPRKDECEDDDHHGWCDECPRQPAERSFVSICQFASHERSDETGMFADEQDPGRQIGTGLRYRETSRGRSRRAAFLELPSSTEASVADSAVSRIGAESSTSASRASSAS